MWDSPKNRNHLRNPRKNGLYKPSTISNWLLSVVLAGSHILVYKIHLKNIIKQYHLVSVNDERYWVFDVTWKPSFHALPGPQQHFQIHLLFFRHGSAGSTTQDVDGEVPRLVIFVGRFGSNRSDWTCICCVNFVWCLCVTSRPKWLMRWFVYALNLLLLGKSFHPDHVA